MKFIGFVLIMLFILGFVAVLYKSYTNKSVKNKDNELHRTQDALRIARDGLREVARADSPQLEVDVINNKIQAALNPPRKKLAESLVQRRIW